MFSPLEMSYEFVQKKIDTDSNRAVGHDPEWLGADGPSTRHIRRRVEWLGVLEKCFDTAWQRQPEAHALQSRRDAAQAQAKAALMLSPEPPSLDISQRSDQMTGNSGSREAEVGTVSYTHLTLPTKRIV